MNHIPYEQQDFLMHHGILGQKWGIRRWQNEDGSLTEAGKKKYTKLIESDRKNLDKKWDAYQEASKKVKRFEEDSKKRFKKPTAAEERKAGIEIMDSFDDQQLKNMYGETYNRSDSKAKNKFYDRHFKSDFYDYYYDDAFDKPSYDRKEHDRLNKEGVKAQKAFEKQLDKTLKRGRSLLDSVDLNVKMGAKASGSASGQKYLIDRFNKGAYSDLLLLYLEKRYAE